MSHVAVLCRCLMSLSLFCFLMSLSHVTVMCCCHKIFKALALWADAFYKLKCSSVCPCVRPSVSVFTFEVPFKRLFAPSSQSWMSNILEIRNPWRKVIERSGLRLELFCLEVVFNRQTKKTNVFFADFALQNKVGITLSDGLETSGQRAYC